MMQHREPLPDWKLERFALGELPPAEQSDIERRLANDPELRSRLDTLTRSNREILAAYPTAEQAQRIDGRVRIARAADEQRRRKHMRTGLWLAGPVLAGAAVLMMTVTEPDRGGVTLPTGGPDEVTRIKGDPQLVVHARKDGEAQIALSDGDTANAGDLLQVSYRAGDASYGVILSIDGRGAVTLHLPDGPQAARLQAEGLVSLEHAYELDDAPNFERFFFVTDAAPFEVQRVVQAARRLAADPMRARRDRLPIELEQTTVLLEKAEGGQP